MVVKKKKFDIIFANGCSYVQGCGLNGDSLPSSPVKNVKNRFSELIAIKGDAKEVNIAAGGAGNDKIFRTTFEWFEENKEEIADLNILVCLGLTISVRKEMFLRSTQEYTKANFYGPYHLPDNILNESRWLTPKEAKEFTKLYYNEFFDEKEHARSNYRGIRCLIDYLNTNFNVTIYTFNALDANIPDYYIEGLNLDKKYLPSWSRFISDNGFKWSKCSHPLEDSHKEIADHIISKYNI